MSDRRPILVVDFAATDRERIINALHELNLCPTDEQAEELRCHLAPLPEEDRDLTASLLNCVEVDWSKCPDKVEPILRRLVERYKKAASHRQKRAVEMEMVAVTKGLPEHPDWFTYPCNCDECRSYNG